MIVSITYIELKGPFKFFALSARALKIVRQLKSSGHKAYKSKGVWTKHYTMSLWPDHETMMAFVRSGAHLDAMKTASSIAKEIKVVHYEGETLPSWTEAKKLVAKGRSIKYS